MGCVVRVLQGGVERELVASIGSSLYSVLIAAGYFVDAPCAGNGTCGKCKIKASGAISPMTKEEEGLLLNLDLNAEQASQNGERLACYTSLLGDCRIELMDKGSKTHIVQTKGSGTELAINSRVVQVAGIEKVGCSDDFFVGMAVDIGTTTVASYYYNLLTGELLDTESGLNAQRPYGADVISRIEAGNLAEHGFKTLQAAITGQINSMTEAFCKKNKLTPDCILDGVIVGNTVMLHLLCDIDPRSLAVAPFRCPSLFGGDYFGETLNIHMAENARVYVMDSVAAYVGGDIVAGLLASGATKQEKPYLFLDIGTNGEMAIGDSSGFFCCATAAGPAFEGARICHGVGGISGAISRAWIDNDGEIILETIGGEPAIGICGSGLIDAIAVMLRLGIIDETGRMDEDECPQKYAQRFENGFFMLDTKQKIGICGKDIREIQLAKAAIAAGIETLLKKSGISQSQVERVVLAGGFGSFMSIDSACEIGLLPRALRGVTVCVGNAAGEGAIKALLDHDSLAQAKDIAALCKYIELSGDSFFNDCYMEQMMFE